MGDREGYYSYQGGDLEISLCAYCIHKHEDGATCEAFPDGIPDDILLMKEDHHKPVEGDHGIRFEARSGWEYPERKKSYGA